MLRIEKERQVWWPVTAEQPQDGGSTAPVDFEVRFRLPPVDELRRIADAGLHGDANALAAVITGWRGVQDEAGADLPCTPEHVAAVLQVGWVRWAVSAALVGACRGAAAKNSGRG